MNRSRSSLQRAFAFAVLCSFVVSAAVFAGEPATKAKPGDVVEATGWISDEWCGKANANAAGKDCALSCAKSGAKLVLFAGERTWVLADQDLAKKHVGIEVVVKGEIDENGTLEVREIKAKEKA